jgi:polar amino acid transport system substrate-binding protein
MANQFIAGRFDAMIVLDPEAIEKAMKDINFANYSYANYRYVQKIGNYYGMSKKSPRIAEYKRLNAALLDLAKSGRVRQIYRKYNVPPPVE